MTTAPRRKDCLAAKGLKERKEEGLRSLVLDCWFTKV